MKPSLEGSFRELSFPATVGIAIAAADGTITATFGTWSIGVAWSTIKVPLAIAAMRAGLPGRDLVAKSIAQSDNAAAENLWSGLGDPADAARQVQAVLADAGDTATAVESRRIRPGYTAFGQTRWSLARQAQFAARLPGIPDACGVVDVMRDLAAGHRSGLSAKGIAAKGGWGPGMRGDYLVRQFGIAPTNSGHVGVALAAEAHDGVFETGVQVVNKLTDWLFRNVLAEQ